MGKIAFIEAYVLSTTPNTAKELCLVDPLFDMMNDKEWERSYLKLDEQRRPSGFQLYDNHNEYTMSAVTKFAPDLKVTPYGLSSLSFFELRKEPIVFLLVDSGDHLEGIVFDEINLYKDRLVDNGLVFFHDYKNQFVAPMLGAMKLCENYGYEMIEMPWEEAEEIAKKYNLEEKDNASWLNYGEIKYFNFMGCCRKIARSK
jgi:hypothetical protein